MGPLAHKEVDKNDEHRTDRQRRPSCTSNAQARSEDKQRIEHQIKQRSPDLECDGCARITFSSEDGAKLHVEIGKDKARGEDIKVDERTLQDVGRNHKSPEEFSSNTKPKAGMDSPTNAPTSRAWPLRYRLPLCLLRRQTGNRAYGSTPNPNVMPMKGPSGILNISAATASLPSRQRSCP